MECVGEETAIHWDRLSVDLVCPTVQPKYIQEKSEKE